LYGGMAASYWCSLNGTWVSSFRNHYSPKWHYSSGGNRNTHHSPCRLT
jgi:hypothetical protein